MRNYIKACTYCMILYERYENYKAPNSCWRVASSRLEIRVILHEPHREDLHRPCVFAFDSAAHYKHAKQRASVNALRRVNIGNCTYYLVVRHPFSADQNAIEPASSRSPDPGRSTTVARSSCLASGSLWTSMYAWGAQGACTRTRDGSHTAACPIALRSSVTICAAAGFWHSSSKDM